MAQTEKDRRLPADLNMNQTSQTANSLTDITSPAQAEFTSATHAEHVRPMFRVAWAPCLAAFSVGLQGSADPELDRLCLDGIRCGVRIACVFQMQVL